MNALIVYDSAYGNTKRIATAIQDALRPFAEAKLVLAQKATTMDVESSEIMFIGSPTQGGRPTQAIQDFMERLDSETVKDKYVATFDTRFARKDHGLFLRFVMGTIGFAAPKMASTLEKKGAILVQPAEGFIVADTKGPLDGQELTHAFSWAQKAYASLNN